jgi:hypothetical protein
MRSRQEGLYMLKRIGFALVAIALLLPLQVMAQKGRRSASHSSPTSSTTHSRSTSNTKKHLNALAQIVGSEEINRRQTK